MASIGRIDASNCFLNYGILNKKVQKNDDIKKVTKSEQNIEQNHAEEINFDEVPMFNLEQHIVMNNIKFVSRAKSVQNDTKKVVNTRVQHMDDGSYSVYETDKDGKDLRRIDYDKNGSLEMTLEWTYNNDGTQVHTCKNAQGSVTQITELDANGNVRKNYYYKDDGSLFSIMETSLDENGIETTIFKNISDKIISKQEYDTIKQKRLSEVSYDINGKIIQKTLFDYDSDGGYIETSYDANGKILLIANYKPNGLAKSYEYYGGSDAIQERTDFYYTQNGKRIEIASIGDDIYSFKQYDNRGQLIFDLDFSNKKSLNQMHIILQEYKSDYTNQVNSLVRPIPPDIADFIENNRANEQEYATAMEQYEIDKQNFMKQSKEFMEESINLERNIKQINKKITETGNKNMIPVPHDINDFVDENGQINEQAYSDAMVTYQKDKYRYQLYLKALITKFAFLEKNFKFENKNINGNKVESTKLVPPDLHYCPR